MIWVESPPELSLSIDEGILAGSLLSGNHTVVIVARDGYVDKTEPGTPDISITVEVLAVLALSDKNPGSRVTVIVNESEEGFYRFEALGGYGDKTYNYVPTLGFTVASDSGTLSYDGAGTVGEVVLTVWVDDESSLTPEVELLLSVGISAALSATWSKNVQGFVGRTGDLSEVGLSGVGGIPPYTYSLVAGENISLDERSGKFRITMAFTSAATVSVVWSMEDSDMGRTPAVSGTVVLDISGDLSFTETAPVVSVTVGEQAGHVIYTAKANTDGVTYAQIGGHSSFTVVVSDAATVALVSMIGELSAESTVTLTIEASKGEERATLTLEVRAYDELSASLAADFVGQIYEGESGELGVIEASGGSGVYVYEWTLPLPAGFSSDADGVLEADGQATVGVYTITAIASDDELSSWVAATAEATVSVGAALSLLEIEDRLALVQGEVGEELLTVEVSGGKRPYSIIGQDLPSGLTISVLAEGPQWVVRRASNLSVGANVGTVIIDDSYSAPTNPGTPALTAVLTIVGVGDLVIASPQTLTATMGVSGVLAELSAEGGTEAKGYELSPELDGFSLSPAGVLSVSVDVDAGSYTLTVEVSDETARVEQTAMATLLVEVLGRLQLSSVPSLTVTTSETQDVVYSFVVEGGVGEKIYSLENTVTGFEFDGGNLRWLGDDEAGLYTLSVLVKDGSPQPQESRVLVTVLVIENLVLAAAVLSPVWSSFEGAVSTLSASGGNGGELTFGLVGDSQVFTLAAGSSTLSLNAGLRGHQGAATLSVSVSVSDGNDSAEEVIEVLVSGALQVSLDGLISPVHAQYAGLVGSVVVLGGYAGDVSLTLSGSDKDKFELSSGGSLSLSVNVSGEQTLTVTVMASRGGETAVQEVVVSVYAPLGLSVMSAVTVTTNKGDVLAIIEGLGGDVSSYSYELTSPLSLGISINAVNGELLLSLTMAASHTLTVKLSDGVGSLPESQEISVLVIEPLSDISEAVLAVTLIEDVGEAAAYTFTVTGGIAPYSYTFVESQSLSVNAGSGVLSYAGGAVPGVYVMTVSADDAAAASAPIELLLTVEVSAKLSAALSEGARDGVYSFVNFTGVVPGVGLSGVGGIAPYTFTLLANDNFGIDADGKNFRITSEFTDAVTVSAVWVLEDSDGRTPAVTGTVQVEIRDELGFVNNSPVVNVTVGVKSDGVLYTAKAQQDDKAVYSQIGRHPSFTVVVSDPGAGALVSMTSALSVAMTATLTIQAVDGGAQAILTLEVRAFDELSVGLSDDFAGQTYAGETGALGAVEVSGGSGDYSYALLSLVPGFEVSQGTLSVDGQAAVGVHTLTVIVSDEKLAKEGWVMVTVEATVSVGGAFGLSEEVAERLSVLAEGGGVALLTLSGEGGERPYTYDLVTLTSALTMSLSGDEGVLSRVVDEDLPAGDNTVVIVVSDNYEGTTEPGTPDITVTVILSAVLALSDKNPGSRATVIVNESEEGFYRFEALGGYGDKTYSYVPTLGFTVASDSGLLNYDGVSGKVGEVVLTVSVDDESSLTPKVELLLSVGVSAALSAGLSEGARQGVVGYVNVAEVLSGVELWGVGGIPPYTFTLLANDNFGIDEDGKNFRITTAFAAEALVSAVWVLEDSYSEDAGGVGDGACGDKK